MAELMIVVLTLAILATIAYPSYETFIRQSRLENARADLLVNAQMLERYYAQKHTFENFNPADLKQNKYFVIDIPSRSENGYELTARPNNDNTGEKRVAKLNDSGIVTICESSASDANCFTY